MPTDDLLSREESVSPACRSCVHYYVTWDKGFPHGCKAMGFKCRNSPFLRVRQASGMDCQLYVRKEKKQG
jgi:hypothetical protein